MARNGLKKRINKLKSSVRISASPFSCGSKVEKFNFPLCIPFLIENLKAFFLFLFSYKNKMSSSGTVK